VLVVGLPSIRRKQLNLASGEWPHLSLTLTKILLAFNSAGAVGLASDPGVTADFPWDAITKGKDGIVDVGGGQGTLCCSLAAK
jgi:hypothetical protein